MDFELPGENHPKRGAIRAWFEANPHPSGLALAQAGFAVPHWPKPWGLEADAELQLIIDQEMKRAGVHVPRNPVAINNCAQSLLTHGTEAQRQHFLWPALSGEHTWCMLFSEPSGGSDLGALRTVARREGDHYVVKGHKIWTSLAHKAKVGVLVARTDPDQPKHKGLSEFLVDMDTPGIRVRPIIDMSAHENEYNEVFLEEVRLSGDLVLGESLDADTDWREQDGVEVPDGWMGLDIGDRTAAAYSEEIAAAGTVFWNGPMGIFEVPAFSHGTMAMVDALVASSATTVVGVGDSGAAVVQSGKADKMSHVSTGGGASLELIEGRTLPGIAALE